MELERLREDFKKLPEEQAAAILNIIEHKTSNDMKEIIAKMDNEFRSVNNEFKSVNNEFKSVRNEIKIVYWVIGIAMAIMIYFVAKK